ncbi:hypothetical protein [Dictyobacter arantiisoli]|uniref:Uncharacterized protein n=1 Tax=Dictyobacter arantiisoli TaxID=2014874 RepID=A0A5A5T685_9CHLR|nr:hypothetical protein [Dictyobacter arantiisoli]GCF06878.1 hypothetical protein KDI_04420 [Dictyobacter arantiisoli]
MRTTNQAITPNITTPATKTRRSIIATRCKEAFAPNTTTTGNVQIKRASGKTVAHEKMTRLAWDRVNGSSPL